MNIVVAVKVVPEDTDIQVAADRTLDYSRAHAVVSTYDLNAIEAAAQAAKAQGAKLFALAIGPASINDSKNNKNILARGVDELYIAADDALANMDAHATAAALAEAEAAKAAADAKVAEAQAALNPEAQAAYDAAVADAKTAEENLAAAKTAADEAAAAVTAAEEAVTNTAGLRNTAAK